MNNFRIERTGNPIDGNAFLLVSATQASGQGDLVRVLTRPDVESPGYPPDFQDIRLGVEIVKPKEPFKRALAESLGRLIDRLPGVADNLTGSSKDLIPDLYTHALQLAEYLRQPIVLQASLARALEQQSIPAIGRKQGEPRYTELLREAVFVNQGDGRHEEEWLGWIREGRHPYLPGKRREGLIGIMYIPQSSGVSQPSFNSLARAGLVFGEVFEAQSSGVTPAKLGKYFFWPMIGHFGVESGFFDQFR